MVGVIDNGLCNVGSVVNMLKKAGSRARVLAAPEELNQCERLVLPGVGSFDAAVENLDAEGWRQGLEQAVLQQGKPFLGICLGMQLIFKRSQEGQRDGLGWLKGEVVRFPLDEGRKVPHMGWNRIKPACSHAILADLAESHRFYFVHSFYVRCPDPFQLCTTDYGVQFVSGVCSANILGVQFHPEKSHRFGLQLFRGFLDWRPQ